MENDELKHYGVKGMKWGVRKNPSRTYAKASKHANKLKENTAKLEKKSVDYHNKTLKRLARPSFSDFGIAKERRMAKKDARMNIKAQKAKAKSEKFESEMRKAFKDVSIKDISKADLEVGQAYIDMLMGKKR